MPRHRRWLAARQLLVVLAIAAAGAGCSVLPAELQAPAGGIDEIGLPYPDGCAAFELTARQCEHIVARIGSELHVDRSRVREIRLLGDPGCQSEEGDRVICMSSMQFVVRVRFVQDDDRLFESSQFCGVGGEFDLACTDPPKVRLSAPTLNGYGDVPCSGEPPDGCASPVPTIDPGVAGKAKPVLVATLDVPIDHVGHHDIRLGEAVLPNGILTESSFTLADDTQTDFLLTEGVLSLQVAGPDGTPIWNVYEQGWRQGTETVDVHLVFDVQSFDPGALLRVRDVVVR